MVRACNLKWHDIKCTTHVKQRVSMYSPSTTWLTSASEVTWCSQDTLRLCYCNTDVAARSCTRLMHAPMCVFGHPARLLDG